MRKISTRLRLRLSACLPILAAACAAGAVHAQTTGSETAVEELVVTASQREAPVDGLGAHVTVAKDESVVQKAYIDRLSPGANFAQIIDILPGVTYLEEDPTGLTGGDFRLHGFDGPHVSFTLDGTPLNDTGSYAIFPGEYPPPETIDHITLSIGQAEVDTPSASSIGGTVNITGKIPTVDPGAFTELSGGAYGFFRTYLEYDTGAIGPTGLRSYFALNLTDSGKYKGPGYLDRWGFDGKFYQPLKGDDFVSLAYTYAQNRTIPYGNASLSEIAQFGRGFDFNNRDWVVPTAVAGKADIIGTIPAGTPRAPNFESSTTDSGFYALFPNPVNFADVRGQSRFDLGHDLKLTVDPYVFYTLANGGGETSLKEADLRLTGSLGVAPKCAGGGAGVDLNGDGDCLDSVLVYTPNNTETHRYGVNSSLVWQPTPDNVFQFSYELDYGRHRETGEYGFINQQTGIPLGAFGGLDSPQVSAADGTPIQRRDRFSIAELNQLSFNYLGKFLDDRLHVNVGLRDPYFTRQLNQFCFMFNGTSTFCDAGQEAAAVADLAKGGQPAATALGGIVGATVRLNAAGQPDFRLPFRETLHFNSLLPNAGVSFNFDPQNEVYATFLKGFSAPVLGALYTSSTNPVQPETSYNYGVGYRYQAPRLTASVNLWDTRWNNHIVFSIDPDDPTQFLLRNVGNVNIYGLDAEVGWKIDHHFNVYASGTLQQSQVLNDYDVGTTGGPDPKGTLVPLPVKGKSLVLTPKEQFALRGSYHSGPWEIGLTVKHIGSQYVSDINDLAIADFTVLNLDASYSFNIGKTHEVLQANVFNLTNNQYFVRASTGPNFTTVTYPNGDTVFSDVTATSGTPFLQVGAPITAWLTLKSEF